MGAGNNAPTKFLDPWECQNLFSLINQFFEDTNLVGLNKKGLDWSKRWATARDYALAGVMIGAGIRVEEVSRMTVNCTFSKIDPHSENADYLTYLTIPAIPGVEARNALCFPIAEISLLGWLKWRENCPFPTDPQTISLFPANIRLRRHDMPVTNIHMHPSSIFRSISKVLASAKITGNRVGGQTLRNTYAALLVEAGCNNMEIQSAMGLKTALTVLRLRDKLLNANTAIGDGE